MINKRTSKELYTQASKIIPGGVSRNTVFHKPFPHYASHASGAYVTSIDGTKRIDFANNMAALIHGHAHPAIVEAVTEQLQRGTAYTMATEAEVRYAQLLTDRVPSFEKIRFTNSGTEAVMAMIKASRAHTGRPKIAKAEGSYHGTYDFAEVSQVVNPENWGDFPALDKDRLSPEDRKRFQAVDLGPATLGPDQLSAVAVPEIPSTYVEALEQGWKEHVLDK